MALDTPKLSPRATERTMQELLYNWSRSYFNGQPHFSKSGDVTFPAADFFFNQTQIDTPTNKPQIHFVFGAFRPVEMWWANGDLLDWSKILATVGSGVSLGLTASGVQESVHGRGARLIPGATDIRWRSIEDDYVEEALIGAEWTEIRRFPDTDRLRWRRVGGDYVEEGRTTGTEDTWLTIRTITTINPLWDGTKKLVTIGATILVFVRAVSNGENANDGDYLCRSVADNLRELIMDEESRAALTQKGFRRLRVLNGPTPMASSGYQTRLLTLDASLRYFTPRLH